MAKKKEKKPDEYDVKILVAPDAEDEKKSDAVSSVGETRPDTSGSSPVKLEISEQDQDVLQNPPEDPTDNAGVDEGEHEEPEIREGEEPIKGIRRLVHRVHKSIAGILSVSTNDKVTIDDEELDDLDEAGAYVAQKYDTKGYLSKNWPEILYAFTLAAVGLKATWKYLTWKKQEPEQQKDQVAGVELPDSPKGVA